MLVCEEVSLCFINPPRVTHISPTVSGVDDFPNGTREYGLLNPWRVPCVTDKKDGALSGEPQDPRSRMIPIYQFPWVFCSFPSMTPILLESSKIWSEYLGDRNDGKIRKVTC